MSAAPSGVRAVAASNELINAPAKARVFIASSRDRQCTMARRLACYYCRWRRRIGANAHRPTIKPSPARNRRSISIAAWQARPRFELARYPPVPRASFRSAAGGRPTASTGRAGDELPLLDREDLAGFHLDVAHHAGAPAGIDELHVIAAGGHAGDQQPLVRIDGAVLVVLALVGAPARGAGRRQIEL